MNIEEIKKHAEKEKCSANFKEFDYEVCHVCHNAPAISCSSCATGGMISTR